ncbi:diacylglycerol kinase family protein [Chryseobacterium taichungense]|uniref:diacylglycerol kinase family protein n=1 Tax=Chryseobacterium taichungense TaxID=295069 RepID=UPI0028A8864B|nr:diacylglycerol kinase family protein [Chryseobacterium taichungense]
MRKPPVHKSFSNAFRGIFLMIKWERNFQIEMVALLINLFLIFYLKLTTIDAILIMIVCFGVLAAEIFNTAIEKICDIIRPEFDTRIGFIKDIAAGAVLLITIVSIIAGILIYWKYVFS